MNKYHRKLISEKRREIVYSVNCSYYNDVFLSIPTNPFLGLHNIFYTSAVSEAFLKTKNGKFIFKALTLVLHSQTV